MKRWYPMGVVASVLTGKKLTNMAPAAWRGIDELIEFLDTTPDGARKKLLELHTELDVDYSDIVDWEAWTHEMRARFGCQVEFDVKETQNAQNTA